MPAPPSCISTLVDRFEEDVFDPQRRARVRLAVGDKEAWDVVLADGAAAIAPAVARPDAVLTGDG